MINPAHADFAAHLRAAHGSAVAARYLIVVGAGANNGTPASSQLPKKLRRIPGRLTSQDISGVTVQALETDFGLWIPRHRLCQSMGWPISRLSQFGRGGWTRELAIAGYSGEIRPVRYHSPQGERSPLCLSFIDAQIAVSVLGCQGTTGQTPKPLSSKRQPPGGSDAA